MMRRTALIVVTVLAVAGCGRVDEAGQSSWSPEMKVQSAVGAPIAADGGLTIGGPCKRSDGWQPPELGTPGIDSSERPVALGRADISAIVGPKDLHELPPGQGYCIAPGGSYPNGYFTMNCAADSDCPSGAFCDGRQCRHQCASSAECGSGMTCSGTPKPFCQGTAPTFHPPE